MREYDLVVIGSGPAGQKAAIAAAKLDKQVAIVERNADVGGVCIHQGTIPSKTLREVVSYLTGVRQRHVYGAAYRIKEKITIEDLTFRTQRVIEAEVNVVRDQLIRNYVDIVSGNASLLDPHRILVTAPDSTLTLTAEKIIIAAGTVPGRPPGIQFDDRRIIDSDGLLNLTEVPRTMTFVGAGVVGAEYSTIFQVLGVRVTLIDGRERPLDFVDHEIEDALYYHMRDQGVTLRFGERVSGVVPSNDGRVLVSLESGKTLTTDSLMFSAGRIGATEGLNLEALGIRTDPRGRITVDETYRTDVESIYAVGDIIGFPSLASTSMEQGRIAAMHAFGMEAPRMSSRLPYGMYTIPEIAMIGPTEQELTKSAGSPLAGPRPRPGSRGRATAAPAPEQPLDQLDASWQCLIPGCRLHGDTRRFRRSLLGRTVRPRPDPAVADTHAGLWRGGGRLGGDAVDRLVAAKPADTIWFLCGPASLTSAIEPRLDRRSVSRGKSTVDSTYGNLRHGLTLRRGRRYRAKSAAT